MPGPNLLQTVGAQATKQTRFAPVFINRQFTGLYTQRNPLRDPSDSIREKFYGGRPDALLAGVNVELANYLTLVRRPGLSLFSTATYPTPPLSFYSFQKINGTIDVIVDTAASVWLDNQNGTKTLILTKAAGAGPARFMGIGSTLYIGDGVDLVKWNDFGAGVPGNNNGNATNPSWNWGIAAPTSPPTLVATPSGSAATSWQASTVFSTMGFTVDSNGNVEQLFSVNALGTNSTQFGTTGNGEPAWNQTAGGTTTETSGTPITWTNQSTISAWQPLTTYRNFSAAATATPAFVYDPVTKNVFGNSNAGGASGTSGATRPPFIAIPGQFTHDGSIKWACCGTPTSWAASHVYSAYAGSGGINSIITEPYALPPLTNSPLYIQSDGAGGTSGTGGTGPIWNAVTGGLTKDNQLLWLNLGTATRANNQPYTAWMGNNQTVFSAIFDGTNMQVCITAGTSGGSAPTFLTGYGSQTPDGGVVWACVGPPVTWAANTIWHLPTVGFSPPQSSSSYGGSSVADTNSNVEFVTSSGKSQTPGPPAWNPTKGGNTTDGGITWINTGPKSANSLAWTKSHTWAYSFASRLATDPYNTTAPPGWPTALGPPTGSASGGISTASPVASIIGANTGAVVTLTGLGSTDPQVDTIVIWRDADGGGADNMFFDTEIPAPQPIGGVAQPWSFNDYLPDVPSGGFPGLDNLEPAPIDDSNDPPPAGFLPDTYHFGRIWGHAGNTEYFTGGPDTLSGNGNETVPSTNNFEFPSIVTRAIATPTGLPVFCVDNVYLIAGGPQTATFFSQPLLTGTGLLSFNALDVQGTTIYLNTADRQFITIDPSTGESEIGFPIGDQIVNFNPLNTYVAAHIAGSADKAVYLSDGSTGWFRCNPNQAPEGGAVWSPKANIVGGAGAVQSIETSPGVHQLLVGGTGNNQSILKRDLTVWADNGNAYDANFTMGSLILAQPGQLAELAFITLDLVRVGSAPTVGFLLDEISGTFTDFNASNVSDPPELYGVSGAPASLFSNRYYFNATMAGAALPPPAWCRHMQMFVDFGSTDTVQNQLLTLTIFGAHYQER